MAVGGALLVSGVFAAFAYKFSLTLETVREKKQLTGAVAVIVIGIFLIGTGRDTQADDHFRDQFQLPASAKIVEMPVPHQEIPSRAVYRIPDADWPAFLAGLNATPTPFEFGFSGDPMRHAQIAQ